MAAVHQQNDEEEKSKKLVKLPTTLASIESLTFPQVHEVVVMADYRCNMCKDRVAHIVSKFNGNCSDPFQAFWMFMCDH
ncbi:hypothetical protein LXL04_008872 [Taraxacum kok-saghyz]